MQCLPKFGHSGRDDERSCRLAAQARLTICVATNIATKKGGPEGPPCLVPRRLHPS
jgi:hypothetical protein